MVRVSIRVMVRVSDRASVRVRAHRGWRGRVWPETFAAVQTFGAVAGIAVPAEDASASQR